VMRTGTIGAEMSARSASALAGLHLAVFGSCSGDRIIPLSPNALTTNVRLVWVRSTRQTRRGRHESSRVRRAVIIMASASGTPVAAIGRLAARR
jgi:hypothetical protein